MLAATDGLSAAAWPASIDCLVKKRPGKRTVMDRKLLRLIVFRSSAS
jgi:hypothetical protein